MSTFDSQFAATGRPALLEQFGRAVTLTPHTGGGAPGSVTAIFAETTQTPSAQSDGQIVKRTATLQISEDDATPDLRCTVTFGSEDWDVKGQLEHIGGMITLLLVRNERAEVSPGDYRTWR